MSITTYGWGSGAITTQGWGAGAPVEAQVITQPRLDPSGRVTFLVLQGKILLRCKLSATEFSVDLDTFDADLAALESDLAHLEQRVRNIEGGGYLVSQVQQQFDCKLDETELDNILAAWDVSLDTIESDVLRITSNLRNVERQLRIQRRQKRVSP